MRSMTALDIGHYSFPVHTTDPAPKFPDTAGFSQEIPVPVNDHIAPGCKPPVKQKSPSWKGRASKKN